MIWPFLFLFFQFTVTNSIAQFSPSQLEIYENIRNLNIAKAKELLRNEVSEKDPASLYLSSLADAVETLITEDQSLMKAYFVATIERISQLKKMGETSPYILYYLSDIRLYSAFVHLKFANYWKGIYNLHRAHKLILQNLELNPDFMPNKKVLGIIQIIFGSTPSKYQWMVKLLGVEGSVKNGIANLQYVLKNDPLLGFEAAVSLAVLQAFLFQNYEMAINNLGHISEFHNNFLMQYVLSSILIKSSRSDSALKIIEGLEDSGIGSKVPMIYYLKGKVLLQKGDYKQSVESLQKFLNIFKGINFIKDAHYKISICYLLLGNKEKALSEISIARSSGIAESEADKYANLQLKSDELPNLQILKIRLFTDGGYFQEAENEIALLNIQSLHSLKEKVEFTYRRARLAHKQSKINAAINWYQETISEAGNNYWYFAPNSCLQLGFISKDRGELNRAKYYFNEAMKYKRHEYKSSIDNIAKAAIESLN